MSHKQLGAYIETRIGKKYDIDLDSGIGKAVEKGMDSYMKAYETWDYTRQSMDHWALAHTRTPGCSPRRGSRHLSGRCNDQVR